MKSLPSCESFHPGEPSTIVRIGPRRHCRVCDRLRAKAKYDKVGLPRVRKPSPVGADYGVLPRLEWPAPEFLLPQ